VTRQQRMTEQSRVSSCPDGNVLISAKDGDKWSASRPDRFSPSEGGLLQIAATYQAPTVSISEHVHVQCAQDQFVNIARRHGRAQQNLNTTMKVRAATAAK